MCSLKEILKSVGGLCPDGSVNRKPFNKASF